MEDSLNRRVEAHALYMTQMLERLGVTPGELELYSSSEAIDGARAQCRTCRASKACSAWLDVRADKPPISIDNVPFFCPNRAYLASLCAIKKS
jgi:hypothetical protein